MFDVFIVEDEYLIRNTLRQQIMSLSHKFPINYVGEAGDGEMALASIIDLQPDIILTDIKMPFMDGLSFAKEARKILPWSRIIFISGFDDFEYMKGAIQVQADEYLLKPVKLDELENAMEKAVSQLQKKKETTEAVSDSETLVDEIKKNHFLNSLFKGELSVKEVIAQEEKFNLAIVGKKYTVLLVTNKFKSNFDDYTHFTDYLNFLFGEDKELIFSGVSSQFIKFLVFQSSKAEVLEKSYQVAHTLIHELEQNYQDDIAVAIGPVVKRLTEIPHSFDIAQQMLSSYGQVRVEKIISYEDDMKEGELSPTHPFKMDLAKEISTLTQDNKNELITRLIEPQGSWERTRMYRFFILVELGSLLKKKQIAIEEVFKISEKPVDLIDIASNEAAYFQIVEEIISHLIRVKVHPSMLKYQSVINHALNYINEHYTEQDMSLNMVADELNLSSAHFSTIFSQSMGKTFIDYLTEQRINHAKLLLKETNLKLTDIALEIGYNDSNYFSYLFKKKTGLSPTIYRQKNG